MARIDAFFKLMAEQKASDLHLSTNNPPMLRINGDLVRVDFPPLKNDELKAMVYEIAPEAKIKIFEETSDVDFGYEVPGIARYRANFFQQKYGMSAVFRLIPSTVLTVDELGLPPVLKKFPMLKKGLVLVTGPTGSGKSTTLAAMVDYANIHRPDHIITIEDPIEFVHRCQNCLVQHREVGLHTKSFAAALRGAFREDPDIMLVGEMRDLETIELALTAAATGHLVFGTLHTSSAAKAVDRVIDVFPTNQQNQIRATLAESLKAVIAQNLFKRIDKPGRVAFGNPRRGHGDRKPGARRKDASNHRHDPGRQKERKPATRRCGHRSFAQWPDQSRGGLRQGDRQEKIPSIFERTANRCLGGIRTRDENTRPRQNFIGDAKNL